MRFGQSCFEFLFFLVPLSSLHKKFSCSLQTAALCSGHMGLNPTCSKYLLSKEINFVLRVSMTDSELQHSCDSDVDALVSNGEEQKELMITVCDIWSGQSVCSLSDQTVGT